MDKVEKGFITFFILLTNVAHPLLWFTRENTLQSQSAYWNEPNKIWYILMHIGIIMTFYFLNSIRSKQWLYGIVAFLSIGTLGLDLGFSVGAHNVTTALLFGTAVASIIAYGQKRWITLNITLCSLAGISFLGGLLGFLGSSGIFLGESIAEILISIAVLVEIWTLKSK